MLDRQALHRRAVTHVARQLAAHGHTVERVTRHAVHDLLVDGQRIAVRAARPAVRRHGVTVGGRRYEYEYPEVLWGLHQHGRKCHDRADVWVFCMYRRGWQCYVVPRSHLTGGPTLAINPARLVPGNPKPHWLMQHLDGWHLVPKLVEWAA